MTWVQIMPSEAPPTQGLIEAAVFLDEVLAEEMSIDVQVERRMTSRETAAEALGDLQSFLELALSSPLQPTQIESLTVHVNEVFPKPRFALRESLTAESLDQAPWPRIQRHLWRERPDLLVAAARQRRCLNRELSEMRRCRDDFLCRVLTEDQWEQYKKYLESNATGVGITL